MRFNKSNLKPKKSNRLNNLVVNGKNNNSVLLPKTNSNKILALYGKQLKSSRNIRDPLSVKPNHQVHSRPMSENIN